FNYGRGSDMSAPAAAGDGFLMRQGYTMMWSGWQGDLIDRGNNVVAYLPEALQNGRRLRGTVRQEFSTIAPGVLSMGVSAGAENGHNVQPYPVLDRASATLTMREHERDPRMPVPASEWELAQAELKDGQVVLTPSVNDLYIKGGFKPGWIYEFIYETEGSKVMGLGFLGVRDLISFVRFGQRDSAGNPNPLAGYVDKAYATGVSMGGRVLRQYVYEGWNQDSQGRKLFDGMHSHTGSGRLFHNTRFAQVGRYPRQHEEHQWPAEYYPFSYNTVPDPFSDKVDGLWKRPATDPLMIHLHTEGDYWVRHVSLTHTDPRDGSDLEIPENVRMYHLTASPHMARPITDTIWIGQLTPNDMSAAPYRRAVLVLLDQWATNGTPPPPTMLPRRSDGTLVEAEKALAAYPRIPGVKLPAGPSRLPKYDYGPEFDSRGIMSIFPPRAVPGQEYPLAVPMIDQDGNTLAGLRYPDVEVPLGTYNGWSLRKAGFAEGDQFWNTGSFVPFARTKAERLAKGDPRLSIEERYPSHEVYVQKVAAVCERLVGQRLMLREDAERMVRAARERNPLDPSVALGPLVRVLVAPGGE
ncbi:MAG TPA: alpha/beta hydrolase domain-containing protein, partial [Candidatus Binataceae bacterium]|nr:alpha/beta hydrolase domain-containing protein [Candidatus Binataceae bacterium]